MTDHRSVDPLETRLTALVRSYTEPAAKPIDPVLAARTAMASGTPGGVLGVLWPVRHNRRVAWLLVFGALVVTVTAFAVAVGSRPSLLVKEPADTGQIVFVRDGDLLVAEGDGSGQSLIATGDATDAKFGYITAAWSPDMRYIAAVRDVGGPSLTPGLDLMTADGTLVRTVALEPGCGPSVSWSPDSSEVAIGTCPADVPRDTLEPVGSGIGLVIAGLDASADRVVALPPEWRSVASARPEVWIRPGLWARWSPDGRWIDLWATVDGKGGGRYIVAADGSGARPTDELTDALRHVQSLDWSPDSRRIAIPGEWTRCLNDLCVRTIDADSGQEESLVVHRSDARPGAQGNLMSATFSPDGKRLAVLGRLLDVGSASTITETRTLFDHDLETSRFEELTSGMVSMTRDASGVAHATGPATGEMVAEGSVVWTADGRKLLYLVPEADDTGASWTLRSIDAAGGGESSVVVRGVQSFDIGRPRP
jgi:dipeptidyl aminopeptidase/acylaminoacyl peptidase